MERYRCRNFCAVLYPEDETHVEALSRLSTKGYKFIAILHDRDVYDADDENETLGHVSGEPKKPHWHIIIKFPQGIWSSSLAKELGIAENYLQQCHSYETALLYLIHFDIPYKFAYPASDLFGNLLDDFNKVMSKQETHEKKASRVLDVIDSITYDFTMRHLIKLCLEYECYSELRRMGSWAIALLNERREQCYSER